MKLAELFKEETLKDAEYPQEEKYNSGTVLFTGRVLEVAMPKVGGKVLMMSTERMKGFTTSTIKEILEETDEFIRFKTRNSIYKLIWKQED